MAITKKELIELLSEIDDNADVTDNLKGIEGVSEKIEIPFDASKLTVDDYKSILEANKVIQGYNKSQVDSAVSKGVESFKSKKMPAIIQEEIRKATSPQPETPEQKAAREKQEDLERRLAEMEQKNAEIEQKNADAEARLAREGRIKEGRVYLTEKKYPKQLDKFLEYFISEDMDTSKSAIDEIAKAFTEYGQEVLSTDMQGNPFNPQSGGVPGTPVDPIQAQVNQILNIK